MSLRKITVAVGRAVNTVRSHLAADSLPRYTRNHVRVRKLSPFHNYLRERQAAAHPAWRPVTVLLREIVALGYTGSHSQLRAYKHERGDIGAARPQCEATAALTERPVVGIERIAQGIFAQHLLAVYEQILNQLRAAPEVAA